jgi:hypothetical protein
VQLCEQAERLKQLVGGMDNIGGNRNNDGNGNGRRTVANYDRLLISRAESNSTRLRFEVNNFEIKHNIIQMMQYSE